MTCATCGYARTLHTGTDLRCPVCACGLVPDRHSWVGEELRCACGCDVHPGMHAASTADCWLCNARMPHACVYATWAGMPCPGRRGETSGKWLLLRQGTFTEDRSVPETALWREVLARDAATRHADADAAKIAWEPAVTPPPRIAARPPQSEAEVAAGQGRQVKGLGRKALSLGWSVEAWYWKAADGTECSAVRLARDEHRAVATWIRRPEEKGWSSDVAYRWYVGSGRPPSKVSITQLQKDLE